MFEDWLRDDAAARAAAPVAAPGPDVDPFTDLPLQPRRPTRPLFDPESEAADVDPGTYGLSADGLGAGDADAGGLVGGRAALPPVHPAVAALQSAIAGVVRAQTAGELAAGSLTDTAALLRAGESVAGLALVEVAAVDRARSYVATGRASTAGWVGATSTIDDSAARAKVTLARRLTEDLTPVGDLLVDGGTTVAHCREMVGGLRGIRPEVVRESAPALVVLARTLEPRTLGRELRERALAVSEELAKEQERRQRQRTGLTLSGLSDGCVSVHGLLAPEAGQVLLAALDAVVHGDRQARTDDGEPDDRDASTRRADALASLAQHALGCDGLLPGQGGSRAMLHIISTPEILAGEPGAPLAEFAGTDALLTRQQLLRLSCDADISRVTITDTRRGAGQRPSAAGEDGVQVGADASDTATHGHTDPDADRYGRAGRQVVDLARLNRTVTATQFRALIARDRGCIIKGCRRRHSQCQAHHVWHWALGGPSDLANYALVCHLHHHQLHEGGKTLQHKDGRWLTPDGYRDPGPPPF